MAILIALFFYFYGLSEWSRSSRKVFSRENATQRIRLILPLILLKLSRTNVTPGVTHVIPRVTHVIRGVTCVIHRITHATAPGKPGTSQIGVVTRRRHSNTLAQIWHVIRRITHVIRQITHVSSSQSLMQQLWQIDPRGKEEKRRRKGWMAL